MFFLRTSLQPLRLACYLRATDCPSWVIDWTAIDDRILELMEHEETYYRDHGLSEQLPSPSDWTARYSPRFEPPIEELTKYQEPSVLLVHGFTVDRVETAVQIPCLHNSAGKYYKTRVEVIKAKIRKWESRMIEYSIIHQSQENRFRVVNQH